MSGIMNHYVLAPMKHGYDTDTGYDTNTDAANNLKKSHNSV